MDNIKQNLNNRLREAENQLKLNQEEATRLRGSVLELKKALMTYEQVFREQERKREAQTPRNTNTHRHW